MRNKTIVIWVLVLLLPCLTFAKKKKGNREEVTIEKKENRYEQLFKDKAHETKKGLITLHKVEGKLYFEIPLRLMGREMLLGSTITATTDNLFGSIGERPTDPLLVVFTQKDSTWVSLGEVQTKYITENESLKERMKRGNIPAVIKNFKVEAYSPDSTSVVIDMTSFLVSDDEALPAFSPWSPILSIMEGRPLEKNFMQENSQVLNIKSFEDNVSVQSQLSYRVTAETSYFLYCKNKFVTNVMTRNFILLPEIPARPRLADPRIGVFFQGLYKMGEPKKEFDVLYYATRWRLEPTDEAGYKRGELVEPKKPIVYYIDSAFPDDWKQYIQEGVYEWNAAFEKIGFKNVMQVKDFPVNDPTFDPDNLKYSCIRYSPSVVANAMGPSWTDPRTGEILNASVYLYHNLVKLVQDWRFLQTAPADPSVRKINLDDRTFGDCLRYVLAHEVGHTLGLMHNMAASAAIPTDSLRSPSFTRKYGTTYSIMDYARNNYVAQPGDAARGVRMIPPRLGLYDYYVIQWLYKPLFEAKTAKEEVPILDQWISEKSGNPVYRYGKQQFYDVHDPSSIEEDLGNDPIKSATYGVKNLKYVLAHLNEWVGNEDKDYAFRENILNEARFQFYRYLNHVLVNLGGVYLYEKYDGDQVPAYDAVPRERQKQALRFVLEELKDLSWLDNMKGIPLGPEISKEILQQCARGLVNGVHRVALTEAFSMESKPFTREEYMNELYEFVVAPTKLNKELTNNEKELQKAIIEGLQEQCELNTKDMGGNPLGFRSGNILLAIPESIKALSREKYGMLDEHVLGSYSNRESLTGKNGCLQAGKVSGFGNFNIFFRPMPIEPTCLGMLQKMNTLFKSKQNVGSIEMQQYYKLMVRQMENVLEN